MLLNILKQSGEKDIALNNSKINKKSFLLRLYFTVIVMLITFFTVYAYRNDFLIYLLNEKVYSTELTIQKKEAIQEIASQFILTKETSKEFEDKIQEVITYDYSLMFIKHHPSNKENNELSKYNFYQDFSRNNMHPLKELNVDYAQSLVLDFADGTKGDLYLYPLFIEYYSWIRMVCLVVSIIVGMITSFFFWQEHKKSWGKRFLEWFMSLKIMKWCYHLSVKLLFINIIAFFFALLTFLFLYGNRYSFFEFINELQYTPNNLRSIATNIEKMVNKTITDLKISSNEEDKNQNIYNEKTVKKVSKELNAFSKSNMELYLYNENLILYALTKKSTNHFFAVDSIYNVRIVNNPYLYTYPINVQGKIWELWIFYYPLIPLVVPYVVMISIIALSIYLLINYKFINKKVRAIHQLHDEVGILANGDLHYRISCDETDELGELGMHLDHMRKSILDSLEKEEEAKKANQELINTMSHDLRTPLTSLMGYLEILRYGKYEEAQLDDYIKKCMNKCEQLKDRADSLFNYFMVFSEEGLELQETTIFQFMKMIGAMKEELELNGFHVVMNELTEDALIQVDHCQIERVFDNIRSNLIKYASKDEVKIKLQLKNRFVIIIENYYGNQDQVESNRIGLKSVKKIMDAHHGSMKIRNDGNRFIMYLGFPISRKL